MSTPASITVPKAATPGTVPGGLVVDHPAGVVGVAADPAQSREVLDRRGDAGPVHPADERAGLGGDRTRVGAVAPLQPADRARSRRPGRPGPRRPPGPGRRRCPPRRGPRPQRSAFAASRASDRSACCSADGISANPGPCSRCTCPPSWSTASSVRMPAGRRVFRAGVGDHLPGRRRPGGGVAQQDHAAGPAVGQDVAVPPAQPGRADRDHQQLADLLGRGQSGHQVSAARLGRATAWAWATRTRAESATRWSAAPDGVGSGGWRPPESGPAHTPRPAPRPARASRGGPGEAPEPWSKASGGRGTVGKADEEAVAVFYGRRVQRPTVFRVVAQPIRAVEVGG